MSHVLVHGESNVGRVRDHNEDSYLVNDELDLYIVADGMGGRAAGEVASAEAVEQVYAIVKQRIEELDAARRAPDDSDALARVHRVLESAIQSATYLIFGMGQVDPSQKGMGTTISAMLVVGDKVVLGQVGDSRIYLVRGPDAVQVTEDHTLVNLRLKMGKITREQAKTAKNAHLITRAVGVKEYVNVDTFTVNTKPGDRFLLCSDGLSDYLRDEDEVVHYVSGGVLHERARGLIELANHRGGKDNITALLIEIGAN